MEVPVEPRSPRLRRNGTHDGFLFKMAKAFAFPPTSSPLSSFRPIGNCSDQCEGRLILSLGLLNQRSNGNDSSVISPRRERGGICVRGHASKKEDRRAMTYGSRDSCELYRLLVLGVLEKKAKPNSQVISLRKTKPLEAIQ